MLCIGAFSNTTNLKKCPKCAENIKEEAIDQRMNLNRIFKEERKIVFLVMLIYFLGVMVGVTN